MNVQLTPELDQFVQSTVQAGRFNSPTEMVCEALRLLEQTDRLHNIQLQELRNRIDRGLGEAGRGERVDGETFMQGLIDDLATHESKLQAE